MKRIAVFPGSFDPITLGHRSIVLRALPMTRCHENEDDCNADMLDALDRHRAEAVPDDDDNVSETTGTDPRWEALKKLKEQ